MSLKGVAAVIGIGELKPTREAPPEATALGLMSSAAAEAITDAGLETKDIDGFLCGMAFADAGMLYPASVAEVMGINPLMLNQDDIGGARTAGMVWRAAAEILTVMCQTVLCVVGDLNKFGVQNPPVI